MRSKSSTLAGLVAIVALLCLQQCTWASPAGQAPRRRRLLQEGSPSPAVGPVVTPDAGLPAVPPSPVPSDPLPAASPGAPASPAPAKKKKNKRRKQQQAAGVPGSPTEESGACSALQNKEVEVPDLVLKWLGDLDQGFAGLAPEFGGNVSDILEREAVVVDIDPTLPDGAKRANALMVTYPANTTGPASGVSFFIYPFGSAPLGDVVRLQYKVMFEVDFDWAAGGTLPGLFQGPVGTDGAQPCFDKWQAGEAGVECFAIRPQWSFRGAVELSMYIPKAQQPCSLWEDARGETNDNTGAILRPKNKRLRFVTLRWYLVDLYVRLNEVGKADGAVLLSLNGVPVISYPSLVIRTSPEQTIDAISFASYFLGPESQAPATTQHVLFKDFRLLVGSLPSPSPSPSPAQLDPGSSPPVSPLPAPQEQPPSPSPSLAPADATQPAGQPPAA